MTTPDEPSPTTEAGSEAPSPTTETAVPAEAEAPEAEAPEADAPEAEAPEAEAPEADAPEAEAPEALPAGSDVVNGPRPRRARPPTPVLVLSGLLVLALVAATTFGVLLAKRSAADRAGAEALATAQAYAVTVTSYDYQNLDRNFADVLDGATGEFKDQYSGASRTLRQLISGAKTTSKGTVLAAGIQSQSTDQVVVLVFIDQVITNAVTPQPKIDRTRVVMTLTPPDGRWLVSKLELQ